MARAGKARGVSLIDPVCVPRAFRVPLTAPRPRFRRKKLRGGVLLVFGVLLIALRWSQREERGPAVLSAGLSEVERVVDGDTFKMVNGARVRLQGLDTPETVKKDHPVEPWGPEASAYTKRFIEEANHQVQLEFDKERQDRFGRFLAFVWHGERMLNAELLRQGLARAKPGYVGNAARRRQLLEAQDEAKRAGRGIWSD